jgi:hypothetical protein
MRRNFYPSFFKEAYLDGGKWTPPHNDDKWSLDNNIALARVEDEAGGGLESLKNSFRWGYAWRLWDLCYYLYATRVPFLWWPLAPFVFLHDAWSCLFGTHKKHKHNGEPYVDTDSKLLAFVRGYRARHWFWRMELKFASWLMSKVIGVKCSIKECFKIYFKDPEHPIRRYSDELKI